MSEKEDMETVVARGNTPLKIILIAVGVCVLIMIAVQAFGGRDSVRVAGDPVPLPSRPQLNETVRIGSFDVTITDAIRKGDSITLRVNAKNAGTKSGSLYSDSIKLRSGDAVYDAELTSGFINVNPGIEKTNEVTFEIPASEKDITVAIRPDMLDFGGAEYTIFDIGL